MLPAAKVCCFLEALESLKSIGVFVFEREIEVTQY